MPESPVVWLVQLDFTAPEKEAEFNEWYSTTHMPDVTKGPGVVKATRYEAIRPGPGQRKYLAIYELESENVVDKLMLSPELKQAMQDTAARGYHPFITISNHTFWKRITTT